MVQVGSHGFQFCPTRGGFNKALSIE